MEVPRQVWPMLVTVDEIGKPETVRRVDPEDLAAVFGEGVRLQAVTLEITQEAVTEGRVDSLLEWPGPYPEPSPGPPGEGPIAVSKARFYRLVHMGDFIRRPQG